MTRVILSFLLSMALLVPCLLAAFAVTVVLVAIATLLGYEPRTPEYFIGFATASFFWPLDEWAQRKCFRPTPRPTGKGA